MASSNEFCIDYDALNPAGSIEKDANPNRVICPMFRGCLAWMRLRGSVLVLQRAV